MKYISFLIASMLLASMQMQAQSYSDVLRFNSNNIEGTARLQAMGSAYGALGADLSAVPINPAGLAEYHATEFGFTMGLGFGDMKSTYYGISSSDDKVTVPFNQMGIAFNIGDGESWQNFTYSIGYTRLADYNFNATIEDFEGKNSLLDKFTYDDDYLADDAHFIRDSFYDGTDLYSDCLHNVWECPYVDTDGNYAFDSDMRTSTEGVGLIDKYRKIKSRGSKGEISIGMAGTVTQQLAFGISVGIQTIDYKEKNTHIEDYWGNPLDNAEPYFRYGSELRQDGAGVNLKLGVLYKPVNSLRLGFALHTPTFFNIKEKSDYYLTHADNSDDVVFDHSKYEYNYVAPGMFVASVAGVVGRYGIVSFDFERSNYGKSKFKEKDDYYEDESYYESLTDDVKFFYKKVNTFRFGLESRLNDNFSLRAGYKLSTSPLKDYSYAFDDMKNTSWSVGAGYRNQNFFFDVAFVQQHTKQEFWVLPDVDADNCYVYESNDPALLENKYNKVIFTLGWRF